MMRAIRGFVQHYEWGDREAIPHLLGLPPDGRPWAEWWLGTHHAGPATMLGGQPLADSTGELPFLLKVLSAAEPLSLQTHPDEPTARVGFDREQAQGISLTDPRRIYRDPFAKPELLCALSPFDAISGFRRVAATEVLLGGVGAHRLASLLHDQGLAHTITALYRGEVDIDPVVQACATGSSAEARLVSDLNRLYPGDPSVIVTLFLNRVSLQPGDALFLGPGNLHAYLHGTGVEVMGASDNVVRGGLTVKHVNVEELLRILSFEPVPDPVVRPIETDPGCWRYPTPKAPFELWRFDVAGSLPHLATGHELVVCTAGDAGPLHHGEAAYLSPGESVVFEGPSTVFLVRVG